MISVVTITFNNFEELTRTLASIPPSTPESPVERVIVNGGACERTRAHLDGIRGPGVTAVSEPDRGIADAFNKGVRLARGDAIVFLNSGDVLIDPEYLRLSDRILKERPELSFVHGAVVFGDQLSGEIEIRPRLCSLGRGMPYLHQTMVVRRSVFERVGEFSLDYKIAMDFDFVCRMHKAGLSAGHEHRGAPVVRMDGAGISASQEARSIAECAQALRRNGLLGLRNALGLAVRWTLFRARRLMIRVGLAGVLARLKRWKHRPGRQLQTSDARVE